MHLTFEFEVHSISDPNSAIAVTVIDFSVHDRGGLISESLFTLAEIP